MRGRLQLHIADEAEATLTITMKIGQWRKLREQLKRVELNQWPAWKLRGMIVEIIDKAETSIFGSEPTDATEP